MSTLLIINQWLGILVIKLAQYTKRQRTVGEAVFQNTLFYLQMCVCEYLYIATSKRREVSVILRRMNILFWGLMNRSNGLRRYLPAKQKVLSQERTHRIFIPSSTFISKKKTPNNKPKTFLASQNLPSRAQALYPLKGAAFLSPPAPPFFSIFSFLSRNLLIPVFFCWFLPFVSLR